MPVALYIVLEQQCATTLFYKNNVQEQCSTTTITIAYNKNVQQQYSSTTITIVLYIAYCSMTTMHKNSVKKQYYLFFKPKRNNFTITSAAGKISVLYHSVLIKWTVKQARKPRCYANLKVVYTLHYRTTSIAKKCGSVIYDRGCTTIKLQSVQGAAGSEGGCDIEYLRL